MNDSVVAAEHLSVEIDDVTLRGGARLQPLDDVGIAPARHEADVLAVLLVGDREAELARQLARLRLGQVAERKTYILELLAGGGEQEIALVAILIARAMQRAAAGNGARGDIMSGRHHLGAEFARGVEQIVELDRLVAFDAGHRRLARDIAVGEAVDHRFLEAALIVEHVMRDADALGDHARVMDIAAGAAGALAMGGGAMIVKLQGHADDIIAFGLEQGGRDRGIDAAGHGDDDAGLFRGAFKIETIEHRRHGLRRAPYELGLHSYL